LKKPHAMSMGSYLRKRSLELATPATRATSDPLAEWAEKNIRLDLKPFSFAGHEYLRDIYNETSRHVVLSKAAQIGGTTWAILKAIHACLNGLHCVYFFPTRTDVLDFSKSRVGPLLSDNPFLARKMTDTDTAGLKRIGDAYLYLRGMQSKVGMKSVPADLLVFDELDEATPDARAMALERVSHSDFKRLIELSNPSLPNYGIDEQYERSDQRHWTMKCPHCNHWTALEREFPIKLGQEVLVIRQGPDGYYRACPKCSRELDVDQGEWIADYPDRPIRGYRISQLFSSKVDPGEILEEYRTTRYPDRFYNLKIGIPWADLERRLDVPTVLALCRPNDQPHPPIGGFRVLGVDTGKQLHAVVIQTHGYSKEPCHVVHLQVCNTFDELDEMMHRFKINCCVIDGLPETHATRDFARRYEWDQAVFLNFFNDNQKGFARWDRDNYKVEVNRTEALDSSRAIVRKVGVTLPLQSAIVEEFARHMASDAKILEEDEETGSKKFRYVKTGTNHFSLAFTYSLMALEKMDMPMSPKASAEFANLVCP
jgi:hypothetical protein